MSEIFYGFVDENNLLLEIAAFTEGDIETVERVKEQFGATTYHPIDGMTAIVRRSIWDGERFVEPVEEQVVQ